MTDRLQGPVTAEAAHHSLQAWLATDPDTTPDERDYFFRQLADRGFPLHRDDDGTWYVLGLGIRPI